MIKTFTLAISLIANSVLAGPKPLPTVESVNLSRYIGKWYEIARFDQRFQKGCTATTATYSIKKNGDIKVLNECRLDSPEGELKVAEGVAWIKDTDTNAKLKVQFFLKGIKLPFLAGDYWIIALDEDYQYAMVGDPSRKYLWILNRNPQMDEATYTMLVEYAKEQGFDTNKLIVTEH